MNHQTTRLSRWTGFFVIGFVLLGLTNQSWAQARTGAITGKVTDATGTFSTTSTVGVASGGVFPVSLVTSTSAPTGHVVNKLILNLYSDAAATVPQALRAISIPFDVSVLTSNSAWSGNNETELTFHWGGRDQMPADVRVRMWQDYLTVFSGIIARSAAELNPETPYWPSSPSSDYEELTPEYQSGDMHEWNVWHGRVNFDEYETQFPRFMTEYGFQSFPEMRTIEAFTKPEDRTSIFTPVMLAHQKNNEGNSIIHDYMLRYYGEPKDFASFLYASQVLQAEGIKIGAEHLRRIRPRNMGGIYWQLNDCWPVASWSSLDYYGRWKALQYYAKRFYAPLLKAGKRRGLGRPPELCASSTA